MELQLTAPLTPAMLALALALSGTLVASAPALAQNAGGDERDGHPRPMKARRAAGREELQSRPPPSQARAPARPRRPRRRRACSPAGRRSPLPPNPETAAKGINPRAGRRQGYRIWIWRAERNARAAGDYPSAAHFRLATLVGLWSYRVVSAPAPLSATDAFALIMERLCQIVAAQSYRERMAAPLILLIWTRLRRLAARFAALAARVRAGTLRSRAPARRAASRPASPPASPPPPRLPNDFAWLVRLVGWEAAGCGSQLQHLLSDPEFAALIAAAPQMGRLLRPLCRMLGVDASALPPPLPGARHRRSTPPRRTRYKRTRYSRTRHPRTRRPPRRRSLGRRGDRLAPGASGCETSACPPPWALRGPRRAASKHDLIVPVYQRWPGQGEAGRKGRPPRCLRLKGAGASQMR